MRIHLLILFAALLPAAARAAEETKRLNVLLITADDLNYDSLGVTGSAAPEISPNLDAFARQGVLFTAAHVNVAVCQPCRQTLMTGRYPHRHGGVGFNPIDRDVPTLGERLHAAGYHQGILAKVAHLAPQEKHHWDFVAEPNELGNGRDAAKYHERTAAFFKEAEGAGKPFFLMANAQDPHRPFAGIVAGRRGGGVGVSRTHQPEEAEVPGLLPDLPEVRREIAEYTTSVHRCDEVVGAILRALEESGAAGNTLVMFLSDHGMALPFAKTNCYYHSTRTPWMVRWPGVVKPNTTDGEHMISTIDFLPTILEALELPPLEGIDGRSFLPLLRGEKQTGRDRVFTRFDRTSGGNNYEMRAVLTPQRLFIFNAWANGKTVFRNESQSGRTFKAMVAGAEDDEALAARVALFQYRTPRELFDYTNDPDALVNLAADPAHAAEAAALSRELLEHLRSVEDPLAPTFARALEAGE